MSVELYKLKNGPKTSPNLDLIEAATVLNLKSYERYRRFQMRGLRELDLGTVYDSVSCKTLVCVRSRQYTDAPPRVFPDPFSRCNCVDRIAEQDMCGHEIVAKKGFR